MNILLLPLGNLQCSWVLGLIEDDWTGKWFMLKARCNPSCRKSLDFPGFNGNESWILCVTTYRPSIYQDKIQRDLCLECNSVSTLQLIPKTCHFWLGPLISLLQDEPFHGHHFLLPDPGRQQPGMGDIPQGSWSR